MKTALACIFLILFAVSPGLWGQVVLIPDPSISVPEDCITVSELSTVQFQRDLSCGGTIRITDPTGTITFESFSSAVTEFSYQFDTPGEYVVLCNSSVTPAEVDDISACIVVSPMVPTIGEWSIIILALGLMICVVVSIKPEEKRDLVFLKP